MGSKIIFPGEISLLHSIREILSWLVEGIATTHLAVIHSSFSIQCIYSVSLGAFTALPRHEFRKSQRPFVRRPCCLQIIQG